MDSMNRRTFFHSLLGLMAIPFVGFKKLEPTGELPLKVIRDYDTGKMFLPSGYWATEQISKRELLERYPYSESDLHRQYRTGDLSRIGSFDWYEQAELTSADINPWHTGELGTVQIVIIDEDANVSQSI